MIWEAGGRMEGPAPTLILSPEQRIGCIAVGSGLEAVRFDAGDLALEQGYAFLQFILRVGAEILGGELARGVAFGAWTIVVFHCPSTILLVPVAVNRGPR